MAIHWLRGTLLALTGAAALAIWLALVAGVSPDAPLAGPLFFGLLFAGLAGLLSAAAYGVLPRFLRKPRPYRRLARGLGFGCTVAAVIVFATWLQSLRLLTPLNAVLLAGLAACAGYLAVPKPPD